MANQPPPYHVPVYIEPEPLGQVAEVKSPSSGSVLDTDYIKSTEDNVQQWNLDPSEISVNEYFVKLNCNSTLVLESPLEESAQAFINIQGDRNRNGGIQVWTMEQVPGSSDMCTLRNFKTRMYLCLNYDGHGQPGQPGVSIVVASPQDQNAQWRIKIVQQ